jgi:hypothetical protein
MSYNNSSNFETIYFKDKKYFELFIGKRILKKEIRHSKGKIPIYSGSVVTPFGYGDTSRIPNFEQDYIIWGIDDALFDFALMPKGEKFNVTDHCGVIKINHPKISSEYVFHKLQHVKDVLGFGWTYRTSLSNMREISIDFPLDAEGNFDLDIQNKIANESNQIMIFKKRIEEIKQEIMNQRINLETEYNYVEKPLNELFTIKEGNSFYTKKEFFKWLVRKYPCLFI